MRLNRLEDQLSTKASIEDLAQLRAESRADLSQFRAEVRGEFAEVRREAGCEFLHVDFNDHLRDFYFRACGFKPTNAGLIELTIR